MARLVVSAVVGVAVGIFAGPAAGFAAFSGVYGMTGVLDPNGQAVGPRIDDLKGTTAAYGTPVPQVYGHPRIAGAIVWCSDKQEVATTEEQGGKGGPSTDVTTYSYKIDVRVLLTANTIAGVRRIWSNGKLIWSMAETATAESRNASSGATKHWTAMRVYTGAAGQLPDAGEETALGIGNAPAYRGRGSVFIEGLNLGGSGYLPNLTFEVSRQGTSGGGAAQFGGSFGTGGGTRVAHGVAAWDGIGLVGAHGGWNSFGYNLDSTVTLLRFMANGSAPEVVGTIYIPGEYTRVTASGMSDAAGIMANITGGATLKFFGASLTSAAMTPSINMGSGAARFLKSGSTYYISSTVANRIDRFSGGTAPSATSAITYAGFSSMALIGGTLYALNQAGTFIYALDAATLAETSNFSSPAVSVQSSILFVSGSSLFMATTASGIAGGSSIYRRDGAAWTLVNGATGLAAPASTGTELTSSAYVDGVLYTFAFGPLVGYAGSDGPQTYGVYQMQSTLTAESESLKLVLEDLATRSGLSLPYLDFASCSAQLVRSLAVSKVTPARVVMEELASMYQQEFVESGSLLRTVARGGASLATLTYAQLGAHAGDPSEPLPLKRANDIERPAQFALTAPNPLNDYLEHTQYSDRLIGGSTAVATGSTAIGFSPAELKRITDVQLTDSIANITQVGPVAVTRSLAKLEPTDVVTYTGHDGSSYRGRILRITDDGGVRSIEGVLDDASVVTSASLAPVGETGTSIVRAASSSRAEYMDIPILRDADNGDGGIYAAMTRSTLAGIWPGGVLYVGIAEASFRPVATFTDRTYIGVTTTALAAWTGGWVFDEISSVTVSGIGTLSSYTRDAILLGTAPLYVIGAEIIYARTATLVSTGVYTLSGLLRHRRGTEWAAATVGAIGARVVLLQTSGVRRVPFESGQLGTQFDMRPITLGYPITSATSTSFTPLGVGLKPFAVVDVRAAPNGATFDLTWKRRTRLSTRLTGAAGISAPLGEAAESYVVRVYSGATLLSMQTVSAAAATVTAVAGNTVNIYQVGSVAGYETTKAL